MNLDPGLAQHAYTLDSALVRDTAEAMLQRLQMGSFPNRFADQTMLHRAADTLLSHTADVDWGLVKSTERFHECAVINFAHYAPGSMEFDNSMKAQSQPKRDGLQVLQAFRKATTNRNSTLPNGLSGIP